MVTTEMAEVNMNTPIDNHEPVLHNVRAARNMTLKLSDQWDMIRDEGEKLEAITVTNFSEQERTVYIARQFDHFVSRHTDSRKTFSRFILQPGAKHRVHLSDLLNQPNEKLVVKAKGVGAKGNPYETDVRVTASVKNATEQPV